MRERVSETPDAFHASAPLYFASPSVPHAAKLCSTFQSSAASTIQMTFSISTLTRFKFLVDCRDQVRYLPPLDMIRVIDFLSSRSSLPYAASSLPAALPAKEMMAFCFFSLLGLEEIRDYREIHENLSPDGQFCFEGLQCFSMIIISFTLPRLHRLTQQRN